MQLQPAAAKEMGVTNRFDPTQNVMGGSRYLRKLVDHYHGNLALALAAYNTGQGNVDRGIIPAATRAYVNNIERGLMQ